MALEKMKQETMHVVPDLPSSCSGIVSEIVLCLKCIWYGRELTVHVFGEFQACSRKTRKAPLAACLFVRLSALVTAASQ